MKTQARVAEDADVHAKTGADAVLNLNTAVSGEAWNASSAPRDFCPAGFV